VTETIRLVRVTCRFGGARPYFICPGVLNGTACGRAVAQLYARRLREDTQQWWAGTIARDHAELEEDEEPFTADADAIERATIGAKQIEIRLSESVAVDDAEPGHMSRRQAGHGNGQAPAQGDRPSRPLPGQL
jgi:hypothetical protein